MKFTLLFIAAMAAVAQSQSTTEELEANCKLYQGTLERVQIKYKTQDIGASIRHVCKTSFGTGGNTVYLDADNLGPHKRTVANSILTQINLVNLRHLQETTKSGTPLGLCEFVFHGSLVNNVNGDMSWRNLETDELMSMCVLQDGSLVDPMQMHYAALANIDRNRNTSYALAKTYIPEDMRLYLAEFDEDFVYSPKEFQKCLVDAHCKKVKVDPCTGFESDSKFVCQQGMCVEESAKCVENEDCTGTSVLKSYGYADAQYDHFADNVGYCVSQECVEGRCVADTIYTE